MIGFIVPIKPMRFSKNWDKENRLLERTLGSIHNQTNRNFKIYIVYTDKPDIQFESEAIEYIHFDLPFVSTEFITDYESKVKQWMSDADYTAKMFDKGRKIMLACHKAKADECRYLMSVDSDDLISNRIAGIANAAESSEPGWVIRDGYICIEKWGILLRKKNINALNGSTNIVNSNLVPLPDMQSNIFYDFNFFEGHGYLYRRLIEMYDVKLKELPFEGVIYTINENNASAINEILSFRNWKTFAKIIWQGRRFTRTIKKEFGYHKI
jgi:hypothetical protein